MDAGHTPRDTPASPFPVATRFVMQFGFLGVGALSTPMIRHFLADGHGVTVWNRTRSKADPLAEHGAKVVDDPADAAEPGGVVMSCLANDAALRAVFSGGAVHEKLGDGGVHVGMSTCSPGVTDELATAIGKAGGTYVACPVLGRPDFVEKRGHRYLLSGDADARARVKPVLERVSAAVFELGEEPRAACVGKLCTNILLAGQVALLGEAFAACEAGGGDAGAMREVWNNTLFPGPVFAGYAKQMLAREFDPLFALDLMLKDAGLFTDAATAAGVTAPIAAATRDRYQDAVDAGLGGKDYTAIADLPRQ